MAMKAAARGRSHDHHRCVAQALARAEQVCRARGVRLTPLRRRVLELVWEGHAPVGAYDILDRLGDRSRRAAPPTVYRALDFLIAQGLVHRIESRNAFAGCARPQQPHQAQYLLCDACGDAIEIEIGGLSRKIHSQAASIGFDVVAATIEAHGLCDTCRPRAGA